jgi:hypothetical protein
MGFIHTAECDIVHNSALIDIDIIDATIKIGAGRYYYFFSSVYVYHDIRPGEPAVDGDANYPALRDNEYGWEKLYAERQVMSLIPALAHARHYPIDVRAAPFQNCYGSEGTSPGRRGQGYRGLSGAWGRGER